MCVLAVTEVCACFIPRDLSNNQISEIAPDAFHGLRALNSLWVTHRLSQCVSVCVCVSTNMCLHMSVLSLSIPPYVCTACMCVCASVGLNNSEVAPALCKQLPYEIYQDNHSGRPAALCVCMCVCVGVCVCWYVYTGWVWRHLKVLPMK